MTDKARNKAQDKARGDLERRDSTKRRRVADRILHKNLHLKEVLLDSLPHPAMLINKDRMLLAANHIARQLGAEVGDYCWRSFGQSEFIPDKDKQYIDDHKEPPPGGTCCIFCMADEALDKQTPTGNPEVKVWDKVWDMNWIPLDEETYLHYAIDVTYIIREDEKLRMSELKYRSLAQNIPGLVYRILVKQGNRMLFFNTMLEAMTGFKESELEKGEVCSIEPHILAEDHDKVKEAVRHACDEKEPFEVEYRFKHKNGDIRWFKEIGRPAFGPNDELLFIDGIITDITERKRAEEALRDREEKWRSLAETAPVIIMNVSRDGTIKFINRVLTQHTLEQVIGTRVYDHIPHDQHDIMRKSIERAFETGKPDSFEILGDGPKGPATAWYENHIGPILDQNGKVVNVTMVAIDITERKQAEEVLAKSEERFRSFTENAPDFVMQISHDGTIQFINRTLEGLSQVDVVGSSVFSWLPGDYVPIFKRTLSQVFEEAQVQVIEHLARDAQMEMRWYSSHLGPIGKRGNVTSAIVVARDITERKKVENVLARRAEFERLISKLSSDLVGLGADEMDAGIDRAMASISAFTEADRAYVFLFKDDGVRMDNTHEWCAEGVKPQIENLKDISLDEELPWFAERIRKREVFHVPDVAALPFEARLEREHFETQDIQSLIVVPMALGDRLIGFLGFDAVRQRRTWTNDAQVLLCLVGGLFANAIERRRAEKELRDESVFRKAVIERAAEGICVCHAIEQYPNIRFTVWNERMTEITGYTMDEINRLGWYQTVYPDPKLQQKAVERMERMRAGDDLIAEEWEITRKDGLKRLLAISASVIVTEGNKSHVLALMHDITEEKKTRKEREEFLKGLV